MAQGQGRGSGPGLRAAGRSHDRSPSSPYQPIRVISSTAIACLVAAGLGLGPREARAGAWTFAAGSGQVILQSSAVSSSSEFGPSSRLYDSRPYDKVEVTLVFEYGIADWLTLIVAPQYLSVNLGDPDPASYSGLGYTDAGVRVRLWQEQGQEQGLVVSAQVVGRLSGTGDSSSAAAVGYEDGELDLRLLAGFSFTLWDMPAYVDLQLAQRMRFGDPPDELHADLTLGVRFAERWQGLVQSFNVLSEGAGQGPYFDVSYEYYKLQLGVAYDWSQAMTLQAAVVSTWLARNAPQENGVVLSALYRF